MAKAPWCSQEIYDAADAFRKRCLRLDGSLFTERRVWTVEGLQSIDARVGLADVGSGTWLDKLEAQLEVLAADEILLGAELVYMLLLPQNDTLASTKREQLDRVLALLQDPPAIPERLDAAFDGGGVASFSTAKAWSPALLRFIIRLAVHLKELPDAGREAVLSDPWAFRAVVAEVRTSTDQMMANAVKHALFPDTFESIISPGQRELLIKTFGTLPGVADQPDSDRKIGRIVELGSAATDGDFNLYDDIFRRVWSEPADPRWVEGVRLAQRLYARDDFDAHEREYKLMLGERIGAARTALLANDTSWPHELATALKHRRQNLVGWRVRDSLLEGGSSSYYTPIRNRAPAALARCGNCGSIQVWVKDTEGDARLVRPMVSGGVRPHVDMPLDVRADYEEARSIVAMSPRGACALLRLATQKLVNDHLQTEGGDLNDRIGRLVAAGLPVPIQQALDALRVIGNEAVHPGELDLRDDADTANGLFMLMNVIVEDRITGPRHIAEMYARLPAGKLRGILNRDRPKPE